MNKAKGISGALEEMVLQTVLSTILPLFQMQSIESLNHNHH